MYSKLLEDMSGNVPKENLKLVMTDSLEDFKRDIELLEPRVDQLFKDTAEKLADGRTALGNHDRAVLGTILSRHNEEVVKCRCTRKVCEGYRNTGFGLSYSQVIDLPKVIKEFEESKVLGKFLTYYGEQYGEADIVISGYAIIGRKELIKGMVQRAVGTYIFENTEKKGNQLNAITAKVRCKFVEMYLLEKIDLETLSELVVDACST